MSQLEIMRRAALRSAFIDQSQSLNIHLTNNSSEILRGVFFAGWKLGLKTGSYYVRTKPAARAMKNNVAEDSAAVNIASTGGNATSDSNQCEYTPGCIGCSS
jgi:ribonucleotide reductase alpha subunit